MGKFDKNLSEVDLVNEEALPMEEELVEEIPTELDWGNKTDRAIRLEILSNLNIKHDEVIKGYTKEQWVKAGRLGISPSEAEEKFINFFE